MRIQEWPEVLNDKIREAENAPFEWGKADCCLWAADVVNAITGKDYAAEFRGKYSDEAGAYSLVKTDLKTTVTQILGEPVPTAKAHRGDVVLAVINDRQAIGINLGVAAAFKAPKGLAYVNLWDCVCAWRVD